MDKPILYKGHEWRGRSGTGYVCDETMALPVYVVDIDGDLIKWNG